MQKSTDQIRLNDTTVLKRVLSSHLSVLTLACITMLPQVALANLNGKLAYRNVPKPPVSVPSATSNLRSSFGGAYQLNPQQREPSYSNHHHPHHTPPHRHPPHHPHPTSYPHSQPSPGITVIYQQSLPSSTQYRYVNQSHVYGGQHSGISQSMVILDWREYNLPAPARGTHWIYEHGRYLQVPNR